MDTMGQDIKKTPVKEEKAFRILYSILQLNSPVIVCI
jgi:hypothetical protein